MITKWIRRPYQESCLELQRLGWLKEGSIPPMPAKAPRYDDPEPLGVEFFRTKVSNDKFENLTLPRTFFGRSKIVNLSFQGTDLSESTLCWNDFIAVDFKGSDLSRSDLRASLFENVNFSEADLSQTDLRHSKFKNCEFTGANLDGAKLTRSQGLSVPLSTEQEKQVNWQEDDGEEPDGG